MRVSYTRSEYIILVLLVEKVIQHFFVTFAFYIDLGGIRSTVVPPWELLMVVGACIGFLFLLPLGGRIKQRRWGRPVIGVLALVDIVGEYVAQGTLRIIITVSFVVAIILLILVLWEYRKERQKEVE